MNCIILVCTFVVLSAFCASAAPIDDPVESTTITSNAAEKAVTKRHIVRNAAPSFSANTLGTPFANRPLYNFFHPNNPSNNGVVTVGASAPSRPFAGLFANRPILTALQSHAQAQAQAQLQQQGIPALQDEVQGLGPQDLQAMATMPIASGMHGVHGVQGVQGAQGFHGLQGLHPFQSLQSLQGMHQGMNGGGGIFTQLPFAHQAPDAGMGYSNVLDGSAQHAFPMSTITILSRQSPQYIEPQGNQYFLPADGFQHFQQLPFHY